MLAFTFLGDGFGTLDPTQAIGMTDLLQVQNLTTHFFTGTVKSKL